MPMRTSGQRTAPQLTTTSASARLAISKTECVSEPSSVSDKPTTGGPAGLAPSSSWVESDTPGALFSGVRLPPSPPKTEGGVGTAPAAVWTAIPIQGLPQVPAASVA